MAGTPTQATTAADLTSISLVFVGGAVGAFLRWLIGEMFLAYAEPYPWTTQLINVAGSLVLGVVTARLQHRPDERLRLLVGVGLCGGFTTFSTFSVETVRLLAAGSIPLGVAYLLGTLAACTAAAMLGLAIGRGRRLTTPPEE